ncbi:MAG: hypothetical protein KTR35_08720 [Gammaproteobacteria bacterium]|nr:hypothetical protein [Gammaproteobacteria bacterium]
MERSVTNLAISPAGLTTQPFALFCERRLRRTMSAFSLFAKTPGPSQECNDYGDTHGNAMSLTAANPSNSRKASISALAQIDSTVAGLGAFRSAVHSARTSR